MKPLSIKDFSVVHQMTSPRVHFEFWVSTYQCFYPVHLVSPWIVSPPKEVFHCFPDTRTFSNKGHTSVGLLNVHRFSRISAAIIIRCTLPPNLLNHPLLIQTSLAPFIINRVLLAGAISTTELPALRVSTTRLLWFVGIWLGPTTNRLTMSFLQMLQT